MIWLKDPFYSAEAMDVTSLPVPFVQELAKKEHTRVPERYVRPHDENAVLYNNSSTTPLPQVPVIDLSKLLSKDLKVAELERLHLACKEWGFFQVLISSSVFRFHKIHPQYINIHIMNDLCYLCIFLS